jgi:hypothetical protein
MRDGPGEDRGHQHQDAQLLKTLPPDEGGDFHFRGRAHRYKGFKRIVMRAMQFGGGLMIGLSLGHFGGNVVI